MGEAILGHMHARNIERVSLKARRLFTKSLIDLKRNNADYDFGPVQLRALDALINQSRRARTFEDIAKIHRTTCLLGLDKH
ncbi:MAG: hypothetical protein NTY48_04040 [Candidatus Diapherotrites archaeon]|nr:hypothetical protein [Candidatus Diapherotrites archaeon]